MSGELKLIEGDCPRCNGTGIYREAQQQFECFACSGLGVSLTSLGSEVQQIIERWEENRKKWT